jgi:hypothetical protein
MDTPILLNKLDKQICVCFDVVIHTALLSCFIVLALITVIAKPEGPTLKGYGGKSDHFHIVLSGRSLPTFLKTALSPFSRSKRIYGLTSQKKIYIFQEESF